MEVMGGAVLVSTTPESAHRIYSSLCDNIREVPLGKVSTSQHNI